MKYNIPPRYTEVVKHGLPDFVLESLKKIKKNNNNKNSLYITGKTGVGKTFTAHCIGYIISNLENSKEYKQSNERSDHFPTFYQMTELLVTSKNKMTRGDFSFFNEIKTKKGFLILDDFGFDKATDWNSELLFLLVDYRYVNKLPTVFTSNFSFNDLKKNNYDERMVDRISEMCEIIKLDGKSKRI
jgi:DNA replication protein DnaC